MGQFVQHHRAEGGPVGVELRDQAPGQGHVVPPEAAKRQSTAYWVKRVPHKNRGPGQPSLTAQVRQASHDLRRVLGAEWHEFSASDFPGRQEPVDQAGHNQQQRHTAEHPRGPDAIGRCHTLVINIAPGR